MDDCIYYAVISSFVILYCGDECSLFLHAVIFKKPRIDVELMQCMVINKRAVKELGLIEGCEGIGIDRGL